MKSKKLLMTIVALTMGATAAFAFTACDDNNKPDSHVHAYGDWQITKPTDYVPGKAVKVCANDPDHEHDIEEVLPATVSRLMTSEYTKEEAGNDYTKVNKYGSYAEITEEDGVYTYVYKTEDNGDISFTSSDAGSTTVIAKSDWEGEDGSYSYVWSFTTSASADKYHDYLETYYFLFENMANGASLDIYESAESFEPIYSYDPNGMYNSEHNAYNYDNFATPRFELEQNTTYNVYLSLQADEAFDLTVSLNKPVTNIVNMDEEFGELEVTAKAGEDVIIKALNGKRRRVSFAGTVPARTFLATASVSNYGYSYGGTYANSGKLYGNSEEDLKTSSTYFVLKASADGTYKIKFDEYAAVKSTGMEIEDADGNAATSLTVNVNEDLILANYVKLIPANTDNKDLKVTVEDATVVQTVVSNDDKEMPITTAIRGLKAGDTTITIAAWDNLENTKTVTVHVVLDITDIQVGDNQIDEFPNPAKAYRFTGTANTMYVVTFAETHSYGWTITDASNPENLLERTNEDKTYLEVTTDKEGKAILLLEGNWTAGTLTITLASEFKYPIKNDGSSFDNDGRYMLIVGGTVSGIKLAVDEQDDPALAFCVFEGEADTRYEVTLSENVSVFGQCNEAGVIADGDEVTEGTVVTVTTDENGIAYLKISNSSAITISVEVLKEGAYRTDENKFIIINLGDNEGLSLGNFETGYYTFNGKENTKYTITVSDTTFTLGQCDTSREWLTYKDGSNRCVINTSDWETGEWLTNTTTFDIITDESGVAYIRIGAFDAINDLTINVTEVGPATEDDLKGNGGGDNEGDSISTVTVDPETGVCEFTLTENNFDGDNNYCVEISFTSTATGNYTLTLTVGEKYAELYESYEAYMNWAPAILETGEMSNLTDSMGMSINTEYKFYFVGDLGDYTLTITLEAE